MSRHGIVPPSGPFPAPPRKPKGRLANWRLALEILLREAVFGILLWGTATGQTTARIWTSLLGLCVIVLWTRRFGLLRPLTWNMAAREGVLIYIGAVCVSNLLMALFGTAP